MELNNNIKIQNNLNKNIGQENFINTTLGKIINSGIDIGLRALLPDVIENTIIDIKNNLLEYGLKDGINKTITETILKGKNAIGIITGNFDNISQIQTAIKKGGTIDQISYILDFAVNQTQKAGLIDDKISNIIKNGKNVILNNIENNIENNLEEQINSIDKLEKSINNWKEFYNKKDFNQMEKEYTKMEKLLKNIIPFEKTINEAKNIENLHNLIKNNGKNFNLTDEEIELVQKLK